MQEEVSRKTIALVIKTSKMTEQALEKAIRLYLQHKRNKSDKIRGKIPLKKLIGQNAGATSIEINDGNIKSFQKVARKYKVDFSLKKDKTVDPPKYLVFFKARDTDVIAQAFKEYVQRNEKNRARPSLKQKLEKMKQIVKTKQKERSRDRKRDRGQSR